MKKTLFTVAMLASLSITPHAQAASEALTLTVNATIQPGTCYFDSTALTFDFGTVYPADIMASDSTLRPYADNTVTAVADTKSSSKADRHTACDQASTAMNFNIDAKGHSAMGVDGNNIITLLSDSTKTGSVAAGFGIAVYQLDSNNVETPISLSNNTNVGNPGNFTLRARLLPLQNSTPADITSGYINAQATLNISYQ
ncbi:fimbrial protein [Trabulsiella odontotermitis]|uniref:fimbrial protein n=1 Tax=Trabulsiella odontotermitis TaxID=379893 RepID=UPI0024B6FCB0|nr:fimbrial protein [Trabulsiella odontotermitis]WHP33071.1 fimbrial protein [Trabulsiella odontotermitis]